MKEVKTPRKQLIYYWIAAAAVILILNLIVLPSIETAKVETVDYGTFMTMTEEGKIKEVQIESNAIYFTDGEDHIYRTGPMDDSALTQRLHDAGIKFSSEIVEEASPLMAIFLNWVLPLGIFYFLWSRVSKMMMDRMGGGAGSMSFGLGKSNAKVYVKSSDGIRFQDVAGEEEAKENLQEIVEYLHDPGKYREIGATMPKGILLVGPPGTGKTMLAKAVAGEANVPFFSMSGSEFVEMFVGMGASKVRDLFSQAKEKAPCIVFIDEIDAIGKKRDGGSFGGNDEREQTLNQLLTEMDGFEENLGVVILAATNRPEALDPALTRPGRFDRRVPVELPDLKGRIDILKVHARKIKVAEDVDFDKVARMAAGASGAELANIVNEAALRAVRAGRKFATQEDMEESIEVVIAGYQKKNAILSDKEKLIVSYHEIGHALVAAMQTNSAPVQKITIIPRTSGALGYTMQVEEEGNHYLMSKTEMENQIATLCGGRAAEEVEFGSVTTGASNDIEKATRMARAMITRYGMSDEFGMVALETVNNQYLGGDTSLACSSETAALIDKKVIELVRSQHEKARQILIDNKRIMDALAEYLYKKETITGEEFMLIIREQTRQKQIGMDYTSALDMDMSAARSADADYAEDET
jgi:cell division protease FtsH